MLLRKKKFFRKTIDSQSADECLFLQDLGDNFEVIIYFAMISISNR